MMPNNIFCQNGISVIPLEPPTKFGTVSYGLGMPITCQNHFNATNVPLSAAGAQNHA